VAPLSTLGNSEEEKKQLKGLLSEVFGFQRKQGTGYITISEEEFVKRKKQKLRRTKLVDIHSTLQGMPRGESQLLPPVTRPKITPGRMIRKKSLRRHSSSEESPSHKTIEYYLKKQKESLERRRGGDGVQSELRAGKPV